MTSSGSLNRPAALAAAFLLGWAGCVLEDGKGGETWIRLQPSAAWSAFDSLRVTWKDSGAAGEGSAAFYDARAKYPASGLLPARGYHGQAIEIRVQGIKVGAAPWLETIAFNGADPGATRFDTTRVADTTADTTKPVVPVPGSRTPTVRLEAGDREISIKDSAAFAADAAVAEGSLRNFVFDYNGDGLTDAQGSLAGKSAPIAGGFRFNVPGRFEVVLKVFSDADSSVRSLFIVQVSQDPPAVDAGPRVSVVAGGKARLQGTATDRLGRLVLTEWKVGTGEYRSAPADTLIQAPAEPGNFTCWLRAGDDDGNIVVDSVTVEVLPGAQSQLTQLKVSAGTLMPEFSASVLRYDVSLPFETASLTLTPTGEGTLTVAGKAVASGSASEPVALAPGPNPVELTVKLDALPVRTYTVTATRSEGSSDASLSGLVPSAGSLDTAFRAADTAYALTVENARTSLTVRPTAASPLAQVAVDGKAVPSGQSSQAIPLQVGTTPVDVEVTAQNGKKRTYRLSVIRPGSAVSTLSGLTVSAEGGGILPLNPAFESGTLRYEGPHSQAGKRLIVTATATDTTAVIRLWGQGILRSGQPSAPLALAAGRAGELLVTVTSQDGKNSFEYRVRYPLRSDVGFAGGPYKKGAYTTTDSGRYWSNPDVEAGGYPGSLAGHFFDEKTGFICGQEGVLRKTTDAGKTWTDLPSKTTAYLEDIRFVDALHGIAVGGVVITTSDGGKTWSLRTTPDHYGLKSVVYLDANTILAAGSGAEDSTGKHGIILKSEDGGATWATLVGTPAPVYRMHFTDARTGYLAGVGGQLRKTADGGKTWTDQVSGTVEDLYGIHFPTANIGYVVGANGAVRKTIDGGAHWSGLSIGSGFFLACVHFWSPTAGILSGDAQPLITLDGGATWTKTQGGSGIRWMRFLDP